MTGHAPRVGEFNVSYDLQGVNNGVLMFDQLQWVLSLDAIENCILTSAYMDAGGVGLILKQLIDIADKLTVYAGINNGVTTYEAIRTLVDSGISVIGIDTASSRTIFHQKAYIAQSATHNRMLMTSANLTSRGLLRNYEGGVSIESPRDDNFGLFTQIKTSIEYLSKEYPENFISFETIDDVNREHPRLVDARTVQRDMIRRRQLESMEIEQPHRKAMRVASNRKIATPGLSANKRSGQKSRILVTTNNNTDTTWDLIWTTKAKKRHLNISTGNTHGTGDFNLGRGNKGGYVYDENRSFQRYYRFELFDNCNWIMTSDNMEETQCLFDLFLDGKLSGTYQLTITYTTQQATVNQNNATTKIKWGPDITSQGFLSDYLDGTISLYQYREAKPNGSSFAIALSRQLA